MVYIFVYAALLPFFYYLIRVKSEMLDEDVKQIKTHFWIILGIYTVVLMVWHMYYRFKYEVPLVHFGGPLMIFVGSFAGVIFLCFLIAFFLMTKGRPNKIQLFKASFGPKQFQFMLPAMGITFLVGFILGLPLTEKAKYGDDLQYVYDQFADTAADEAISIVFVSSEKDCYEDCEDTKYDTLLYVRNNKDEDIDVRLRMQFALESGDTLEEFKQFRLEDSAIEPVEFHIDRGPWNPVTIRTDERVVNYRWQHQWRSAEES
ncbi:hypothetical protein SAMN05421503_2615 [Terribacillus aidingensis]|uniref:Uncharacterized protein n=1 Tax=Terribacillus aidingensis TaxID=586416 RepID=A0A285P255_9BACI|nr:hypothetical protein [Terribacillus aidingensis]SNZ15367.1 hypothetical protein SAMN05421503_2615 [Terribacillus aidingensis]